MDGHINALSVPRDLANWQNGGLLTLEVSGRELASKLAVCRVYP